MLIKRAADIRYSEVTPKSLYFNRRQFLSGVPAAFLGARELLSPSRRAVAGTKLPDLAKSPFSTSEKETPASDATHYNNYYEFGTRKDQPAEYAKNFKTSPWTVSVEGECAKPRKYSVENTASRIS
jgi:sulfoxide reductase catalytic subunit YedY